MYFTWLLRKATLSISEVRNFLTIYFVIDFIQTEKITITEEHKLSRKVYLEKFLSVGQ
jgi:hypothetical protein